MASRLNELPPELAEVADSLTENDQVPNKLKCAICDKIAQNAFKLPCCDQNMCSSCQAAVPETCPICQHTPLDVSDAKPNRTLRLTIMQHLKAVKKKRDKLSEAAGGDLTPTAVAAPSTPVVEAIPAAAVDATLEPSESLNAPVDASATPIPNGEPLALDPTSQIEATADRVAAEEAEVQELEATTAVTHSSETAQADEEDDDGDADSDIEIFTGDEDKTAANPWGEEPEEEYAADNQQWGDQNGQDQMGGQGYDYQSGQQDMFMNGNVDPMAMMQMMQQQMASMGGNWNNMMGMPGMMNMNPMDMMNNMFGMGGMNQNMMNMMGMNGMMDMSGFNGNNFGNNNGWNNQMNGGGNDFNGAYANGYNQNGYDQFSHQGNMSQHNRHQNNTFQSENDSYNYRGGSQRGRGRGRGRGYHNNDFQGRNSYEYQGRNPSFSGVDNAPPVNAPTGPKALREPREVVETSMTYRRDRAISKAGSDRQEPTAEGASRDTNANEQEVSTARDTPAEPTSEQQQDRDEDMQEPKGDATPQRGSGNDYYDQSNGTPTEDRFDQRPQRGGFRGRGDRGGWRGRGGWSTQETRRQSDVPPSPVEPTGQGVIGAPSGPKAMREGNTRGRGGFHGRNSSFASARQDEYVTPTTPKIPTPTHNNLNSLPDNRPRSRERSRSPRRESRRHRSRTPSDSDHESRKERKRKHRDEYDDRHDQEQDEDKYRSSRREHEKHRSSRSERDSGRDRKHRRRSTSPNPYDNQEQEVTNGNDEEKERRRDRDKYRDRSKDRDRHREKDRDREREKKRSSRRDRSASPSSEHRSSRKEREKEKDREREQREKDKDRDSRRASAVSLTAKPAREPVPNVQKQLEAGFRIHGRSKEKERDRLKAEQAAAAVETPPTPAPEPSVNDTSSMQPPTGPRANRASNTGDRAPSRMFSSLANLNTNNRGNQSSRRASQPATPVSAEPADPYAEERRLREQARIDKEKGRRGGPELTKKRSWADVGDAEEPRRSSGGDFGSERDKKRAKNRKLSYKYEDEL